VTGDIVGIAEDCYVDKMGGRAIRPNVAIDFLQIDCLAPPLTDVLIAAVRYIMGKPSDILVAMAKLGPQESDTVRKAMDSYRLCVLRTTECLRQPPVSGMRGINLIWRFAPTCIW
jgi:hypothetical protein